MISTVIFPPGNRELVDDGSLGTGLLLFWSACDSFVVMKIISMNIGRYCFGIFIFCIGQKV